MKSILHKAAILILATLAAAPGVSLQSGAIARYGCPAAATRPALMWFPRLRRATPEWMTLRAEAVVEGTGRYHLLRAAMTRRIKDAVAAVALADHRDCVVRERDRGPARAGGGRLDRGAARTAWLRTRPRPGLGLVDLERYGPQPPPNAMFQSSQFLADIAALDSTYPGADTKWFQSIQFLAVIAAACFGILLARSKQMDLVGVCSVAFIVAFGGGTLRDLLLARHPLFWIEEPHYALTVFGLAIAGSLLPTLPARLTRWLQLPDALGLGLFTAVGAAAAVEQGTSPFIASLFGVITGTFGGVIGDIVCNEVPNLFRPTTPLYASCSFVGAWVYLAGGMLALDEELALWAAVVVVVGLRLAALRFGLTLPAARG